MGMKNTYSKVFKSFWSGQTAYEMREKLSPEHVLVALYLITGPQVNAIGLYRLSLALLCEYAGVENKEAALAILNDLANLDFAYYDDESETVWIKTMALYQMGSTISPTEYRHAWLVRELERYRRSPWYEKFREYYGNSYGLKGEEKKDA